MEAAIPPIGEAGNFSPHDKKTGGEKAQNVCSTALYLLKIIDNIKLKRPGGGLLYFAGQCQNVLPMQTSEDFELLSLIRTGDKKAFEACFNEHWHVLYSFAGKILRSDDDAKDVVQLVYISLWGRREQLEITGSLRHYLLQAVRFQSLKRMKEILDSPEHLDRVQEDYLPVLNNIWDKLHETDLFNEIEAQLETLPAKTREMFLLSRRHQLSIAEIAQRMGVSEKTVRNQLHIALKTLRHNIAIALIFADLLVC